MRYLLPLLAGVLGVAGPAAGQGEGDPAVWRVPHSDDFELNGEGTAAEWQRAEWRELTPRDSTAARRATRVKILYSDTGIYFLFHCEDSVLTATMDADFMNLWTEDVVEVFLWPAEDFTVYFEYELSPLNYELPILVPNYKGKYLGWRPWHYKGERRVRHETATVGGPKESGAAISAWIAEFCIPYALLTPLGNVPPEPGTRWRANLYRVDHDTGHAVWSWREIEKVFHEYQRFGTLLFE